MRTLIRHLRELLTPAERRRWLALAPLLVLTGAIEMVGTSLVFALIKVAGDPGSVWRMGLAARAARAAGWSPGAVSGGAMNSEPTGSRTACAMVSSTYASASASSVQPRISSTGSSSCG